MADDLCLKYCKNCGSKRRGYYKVTTNDNFEFVCETCGSSLKKKFCWTSPNHKRSHNNKILETFK